MHEYLNPLIAAFVSNRTVLWKFCDRKPCQLDNVYDCNIYLKRHEWIPSLSEVVAKMKEKNCPQPHFEEIVKIKLRWQANRIIMCCGIDGIKSPIIDFGTHELHEMLALSYNQSRLGSAARHKTSLLFARGEDFAYGMMFRASFAYKPWVLESNDAMIAQGTAHLPADRPPFFFGLHLRHSSMEDLHGMEHGETACLKKLISDLLPTGRSCVILVATDRPEKVEEYSRTNFQEGCKVIFSNHTISPAVIINRIEHGPFTGAVAMCDLELLSRADVFLGSSYTNSRLMYLTSTFSMLMASLRASSGRATARQHPSYWLPTCGPMEAARTGPDPYFDPHSFRCGVHNDDTEFKLPAACPYYNKDDNMLAAAA